MNSMDFLKWWFDTHYVWSTLLSPFTTFLWLIWSDGSGWRMAVAIIIALTRICLTRYRRTND